MSGRFVAFAKKLLPQGLAIALLWPSLGNAAAVVTDLNGGLGGGVFPAVTAWSNEHGNFRVDHYVINGLAEEGYGTYSVASGLFTFTARTMNIWTRPGTVGAVDFRIDAIVHGDGTPTGDLVAGIVIARVAARPASGWWFPDFLDSGFAVGDVLFVGHALDSHAGHGFGYVTSLLFELDYINPAVLLPDYITLWIGDMLGAFPAHSSHVPWGENAGGFGGPATEYHFAGTRLVPEPASLALLGVALAGLGFARRRKLH